MQKPFLLVCSALTVFGATFPSVAAAAQVFYNADTSQFTSLALNTPTAVDFLGSGDLTITRVSEIGSPIIIGTSSQTFEPSVNGRTNPDWVLGTRSYFELDCAGSGAEGSRVSYEFDLSAGLATTSQLVFMDLDWSEQVTIRAYDAFDNLIPFADTTILFSPGADTTPRYQDIGWAASSGATGLLRNTNNDNESNIFASISSATSIHRLVYEFDFSQVDAGASIRFQVASELSSVPEPSNCAVLLMMGAGALCMRVRSSPGSRVRRGMGGAVRTA